MKREREEERVPKYKVGDIVWVEVDGEYTSYRHLMHPAVVEKVIDEEGKKFRYLIHLTLFDREFSTAFDTVEEYKIFFPESIVPFPNPKTHEAIWFKVEKRMVDGQLVDGKDGGEVYVKGIVLEVTKNQVKCLFDPCDIREKWKKITIPRGNVYRNSEVGNDLFY
jgi:hypothetical protein